MPQAAAASGRGAVVGDPPRNGEGDHAKHVEGHSRFALPMRMRHTAPSPEMQPYPVLRRVHRLCPSTTLRVVPLPPRGRIACVHYRPPTTPLIAPYFRAAALSSRIALNSLPAFHSGQRAERASSSPIR